MRGRRVRRREGARRARADCRQPVVPLGKNVEEVPESACGLIVERIGE
jgi:hypothetical protein